MKTLIIYESIHHSNTLKIAREMAKVLNTDLKKASEVKVEDLENYDLLGFGSGIYFFKHHKNILNLAKKLPINMKQKVFIFSTCGTPVGKIANHTILRKILQSKNISIVGEFACPGWDTFGPYKIIGGLQKDRPNNQDLKDASIFANNIKERFLVGI